MAEEQQPEEVQLWTAKRRAALVIRLIKGETTAAEAAQAEQRGVVARRALGDIVASATERTLQCVAF